MNKAIEVLTKEHNLIKQAILKTKQLFESILEGNTPLKELKSRIDFFRNYADNYHHNKEEQVLFPEMIKRNEMLEYGVVHEMLENHEDFRVMLTDLEKSVEEGDAVMAEKQFNEYAEMLLEHIAVEDDEVFQIAETLMTEDELLTILYLFEDCDRELGEAEKKEWEAKV